MAIARYYNPEKNPDGAFFAGVPLADLDEALFESFPEWLQRSVDECGFYYKTKPAATSSHKREEKES
jgi:hypothetical protein